MAIWEETKCVDLLKGQKVIEISAEAPLVRGCETLVSNGISSAPVYSEKFQTYIGMLDFRDIVSFVLVAFHRRQLEKVDEMEEPRLNDLVKRVVTGNVEGGDVEARMVSDLSHHNPFYSVLEVSPLSVAIDILGKNGVHRVNVIGDDGKVEGVLSQTDIVKFLIKNKAAFVDLLKRNIGDLNVGNKQPLNIKTDSTVLEAMELMAKHNVSSIAIVDGFGMLVGNISMADIRFIFQHGRYNRLWMTCFSFMQAILSQKGLEANGRDCFPFFDVRLSSSLEHTMEKMLATKCHRVWIVDEKQYLIGVVSLTDIVQTFVENYPPKK